MVGITGHYFIPELHQRHEYRPAGFSVVAADNSKAAQIDLLFHERVHQQTIDPLLVLSGSPSPLQDQVLPSP